MQKITLAGNVLVLFMFWLVAQVAITPAHNLLVRYAETGADLPILTSLAIQIRMFSAAVPIAWGVITFLIGWRMKKQAEITQNKLVSLHSTLTLFIGLVILFFFSLAGILPVLKIGAVIG